MKKIIASAVCVLFCAGLFAQEKVFLWPEKTGPGSEKVKVEQQTVERASIPEHENRAISGVTQPYFEIYRPADGTESNKRGILIIPGGAYQRVVYDTEGLDYAKGWTDAGYTCFVLVYRTPNDKHKNSETVALQDAQRAMRIIKGRAEEFGVLAHRIGVCGSSAGGHVAALLSVKSNEEVYKAVDSFDKNEKGEWISAKPAFQILLYPVITMSDEYTHKGSRTNLLGQKFKEKDIEAYSCERLVKFDTPMAFIVCARDDKSVNPYGNAIAYWNAMNKENCPAELHIFSESGHGFGVLGAYGTASRWQEMSIEWLRTYQK